MSEALITKEQVEHAIVLVRGQKVMLDFDLAMLYGVETKALKRAVKRNIDRFPSDFLFVLTPQEVANLRRQIGTSKPEPPGGTRYAPYAFTEQGVAMLSSVLRSPRAVQVNIEVMRAFVRLRGILAAHKDLAQRLDELESKYDKQFRAVFDAIRELMAPTEPKRKPIGFLVREGRAKYGAK